MLFYARLAGESGNHSLDAARVHRAVGPSSREQPGFRLDQAGAIIPSQHHEELGAELHLSVFPSFPLVNVHEHRATVDVGNPKFDEFADTQARAVEGGENGMVLGIVSRRVQKPSDLLPAQHGG